MYFFTGYPWFSWESNIFWWMRKRCKVFALLSTYFLGVCCFVYNNKFIEISARVRNITRITNIFSRFLYNELSVEVVPFLISLLWVQRRRFDVKFKITFFFQLRRENNILKDSINYSKRKALNWEPSFLFGWGKNAFFTPIFFSTLFAPHTHSRKLHVETTAKQLNWFLAYPKISWPLN